MRRNIPSVFIFALGISACNAITPTPTPVIFADSFFSGYAFLDTNGNEELDSTDTPLKDAIFIVQLEGDLQFGGLTDETGNAFVTIPSAVQYPVTLFMKPPEDNGITLLGPSIIFLQEPASEKNNFLFTSK